MCMPIWNYVQCLLNCALKLNLALCKPKCDDVFRTFSVQNSKNLVLKTWLKLYFNVKENSKLETKIIL